MQHVTQNEFTLPNVTQRYSRYVRYRYVTEKHVNMSNVTVTLR
jgi:hypothetical protein